MNNQHHLALRIILCMLVVTLIPGFALAQSLTLYSDPYATENTYRRLVDGWAKSLEAASADVVFFGDSLTLGGAWEEYFPDYMVINLGVTGDVLYGMNIRVKLMEKIVPSKCFVLGGINNLIYQEPVEQVLGDYGEMLNELASVREQCDMTVYVQSVLPVNETLCDCNIKNTDIQVLNAGIKQLADQHEMVYVDVYQFMVDENGMLEADYTTDGLHLTWQGYVTWVDVLQPYMDE